MQDYLPVEALCIFLQRETSNVITECDDRAAHRSELCDLKTCCRFQHIVAMTGEGNGECWWKDMLNFCAARQRSPVSESARVCISAGCSTCNPFVLIFCCIFSKRAYWRGQFEITSKCLPKVSLKPVRRTLWSVSKICINLAKETVTPDSCVQSNTTRLLQFWISSVCTELQKLFPNQGWVRLQKYFK